MFTKLNKNALKTMFVCFAELRKCCECICQGYAKTCLGKCSKSTFLVLEQGQEQEQDEEQEQQQEQQHEQKQEQQEQQQQQQQQEQQQEQQEQQEQ